MMDLALISITVLFFLASWAFVKGCDRLWLWNTRFLCW